MRSSESDPAQQAEDDDWNVQANDALLDAVEALDERSRAILEARWMNAEKKTLHELASEYGVSAERIRQIEANAMKKLRGALEAA